jgi:hypothetical protein
MNATKSDIEAYLEPLDQRLSKIYDIADGLATETEDTLSDEFQLAAGVTILFSEYFTKRKILES